MTYDFRAQQVRLNRIISSGSIPILIYASSSATDLQGGKTFQDPGSDVFLFISGSSTEKTLFGGDVVVSGSLNIIGSLTASMISGSINNTSDGNPYIIAGQNISTNYNSSGQWEISGSVGSGPWLENTPSFIYTTSSVGIKTSTNHTGIDLFISGSDITGNGAALVLYNDLAGFGLPRLILSSSDGPLGGLIGYDTNINGLVDGINIDVPPDRNFGIRIGGSTAATTIDSSGNLHIRRGSTSTAYYDVLNKIVGIGTTTSNLASTYTMATRLVLKDVENSGNKYQLFLSNEYPDINIKTGIAFAFGPTEISGAIYAKANTYGHDRKGMNVLIPTGNGFSWRSTEDHLGELTDAGNLTITGSARAYGGFTGSLHHTVDGLSFISPGPNIFTNYNSSGQWEISGSNSDLFYSSLPNIINTTGSLYVSGSLRATILSASQGAFITGSFTNGSIGNIASGTESHSEGFNTTAVGNHSHAEGYQTIAQGVASHAEGYSGTTAIGVGSHAEGVSTQAQSTYSHTEGWLTVTSGSYSHAEGYKSETKAIGSHAEGNETLTIGQFSHAEGYKTIAVGDYSHAQGLSTVASGSHQLVAGAFNQLGNATSLFIIGNGNDISTRSDIFRVNSSNIETVGDLIISGSVIVSGTLSASALTTMAGKQILKAGSNVIVNYIEGQYIISSSTAGGTEQWQDGGNKLATTSSVAFAGEDGVLVFCNDYGSDVYFYVSGSTTKRSVFKGDVVSSGSIYITTNGISSGYINSEQIGQKNYFNIHGLNKENSLSALTAATGSFIRMTAGSGSAISAGMPTLASGAIGGGIEIFAGAGGGDLDLSAGGGHGGEILISGGPGGSGHDGGSGGDVTVAGGQPSISIPGGLGGNGGNLFLKSGDGGSFDGTAGSVFITHGNKNGVGKDGFIYFKDNSSNASISDDANFFVSGSINSKNGSTRGTSVFGGDLVVSGTVNIFGGKLLNPFGITGNYSATLNDYLISVSSSIETVVILPISAETGRSYLVKDISGTASTNKIKISASLGQLIDGLQFYTLPSNYASVEVAYFGNNIWGII